MLGSGTHARGPWGIAYAVSTVASQPGPAGTEGCGLKVSGCQFGTGCCCQALKVHLRDSRRSLTKQSSRISMVAGSIDPSQSQTSAALAGTLPVAQTLWGQNLEG